MAIWGSVLAAWMFEPKYQCNYRDDAVLSSYTWPNSGDGELPAEPGQESTKPAMDFASKWLNSAGVPIFYLEMCV